MNFNTIAVIFFTAYGAIFALLLFYFIEWLMSRIDIPFFFCATRSIFLRFLWLIRLATFLSKVEKETTHEIYDL